MFTRIQKFSFFLLLLLSLSCCLIELTSCLPLDDEGERVDIEHLSIGSPQRVPIEGQAQASGSGLEPQQTANQEADERAERSHILNGLLKTYFHGMTLQGIRDRARILCEVAKRMKDYEREEEEIEKLALQSMEHLQALEGGPLEPAETYEHLLVLQKYKLKTDNPDIILEPDKLIALNETNIDKCHGRTLAALIAFIDSHSKFVRLQKYLKSIEMRQLRLCLDQFDRRLAEVTSTIPTNTGMQCLDELIEIIVGYLENLNPKPDLYDAKEPDIMKVYNEFLANASEENDHGNSAKVQRMLNQICNTLTLKLAPIALEFQNLRLFEDISASRSNEVKCWMFKYKVCTSIVAYDF